MTDRGGSVGGPEPIAVVRRVLPAPPAVVYDEWLDPESLLDWMCPRPARCLSIELEPWVNGRLRLAIEEAGNAFLVVGRFTALDRPHRLRFTWSCSTWPDPNAESVVTVTLAAHGDGETLMTIQHALLPPDSTDQHRRGWAAVAEQLTVALRRSPAGR
jgi:uncharacterized protein YndB with AHSA1/START domain